MIEYVNKISLADYTGLRHSVGWSAVEDAQAKIGIDNSFFLVVAMAQGRAVGMTRVVSDGGYFMLIVDVVVHPDYQGKGIGYEMMAQVMAHIHAYLQPGQSAMVNLMAAKGKEPFYEKFGFIERPNDKLGAGMVQTIKA
jgi:GNAT superfamily N-acetyltransferase